MKEIAEEFVGGDDVLNQNGASFGAIVEASDLSLCNALKAERAGLNIEGEVEAGLRQILAGERVAAEALLAALTDPL